MVFLELGGLAAPKPPCFSKWLRPPHLLHKWEAAPPTPPAIPGGCAPRCPCNTEGLRPPDRLRNRRAAPPGPPAKPGGCAPRTPCYNTISGNFQEISAGLEKLYLRPGRASNMSPGTYHVLQSSCSEKLRTRGTGAWLTGKARRFVRPQAPPMVCPDICSNICQLFNILKPSPDVLDGPIGPG